MKPRILSNIFFVGAPGIEPGPHGPKPCTLPLCYAPKTIQWIVFDVMTIHDNRELPKYVLIFRISTHPILSRSLIKSDISKGHYSPMMFGI